MTSQGARGPSPNRTGLSTQPIRTFAYHSETVSVGGWDRCHLRLDGDRSSQSLRPVGMEGAEVVIRPWRGIAQIYQGFAAGPELDVDVEFLECEVMGESVGVGDQQFPARGHRGCEWVGLEVGHFERRRSRSFGLTDVFPGEQESDDGDDCCHTDQAHGSLAHTCFTFGWTSIAFLPREQGHDSPDEGQNHSQQEHQTNDELDWAENLKHPECQPEHRCCHGKRTDQTDDPGPGAVEPPRHEGGNDRDATDDQEEPEVLGVTQNQPRDDDDSHYRH